MEFERERLYGPKESLEKASKMVGRRGWFADNTDFLRRKVESGMYATYVLRGVSRHGSMRFVDEAGDGYRYFYCSEGLCHGDA